MEYIAYLIVGFLTGVLSGLLGIGGGVIMVPALVFVYTGHAYGGDYLMQLATGTSLAAMVITTLMTTWANQKHGTIRWRMLSSLIPGTVLGALLGVWVAKEIHTQVLQIFFAVFAILLGLKLLIGKKEHTPKKATSLHPFIIFILGIGIGILSGLLGVGGGILLIPLLLWLGLSMKQASATSAGCAIMTAASGAIMAVIAGWHIPGLPEQSLGFVYWPVSLILGIASMFGAPLGVKLAHRLPVHVVKRVFGAVLWAIAVEMVWGQI